VTVSASAIAPPAAPPVKLPADQNTSAPAETSFHAEFNGAQSGQQPVAPAKPAAQKPSQKPAQKTDQKSGSKTETDPSRTAAVPVFEPILEILAFGDPQAAAQFEEGATAQDASDPAKAPVASQIVSLVGAAVAQQLSVKPATAVAQPQEQAAPKGQTAFALQLATSSILKSANAAAAAPASTGPNEPPAPQRDAAPALLSSVIAQAKPVLEASAPTTPKIEALFTAGTSDSAPRPQSQTESHTAPPARVERPSEILPAEAPRAPVTSPREITVRLADLQQRATDVRFVERAGQVHVSVRTGDAEFARTLRSGLNDLMTRLDHAGIRAEMARPGSDASSFKNDSRSPSDQQNSSGSRRDQKERQPNGNQQNWMEEFQKQSDPNGEQTL
jgi:hypothetical protein